MINEMKKQLNLEIDKLAELKKSEPSFKGIEEAIYLQGFINGQKQTQILVNIQSIQMSLDILYTAKNSKY